MRVRSTPAQQSNLDNKHSVSHMSTVPVDVLQFLSRGYGRQITAEDLRPLPAVAPKPTRPPCHKGAFAVFVARGRGFKISKALEAAIFRRADELDEPIVGCVPVEDSADSAGKCLLMYGDISNPMVTPVFMTENAKETDGKKEE